mmetsp:Transcript_28616/g.65927  ORF Transcript_28616/g.65927 Transcript_28616/m.65927 type:complete len:620 (-) Transcript_28616:40-1899(-)
MESEEVTRMKVALIFLALAAFAAAEVAPEDFFDSQVELDLPVEDEVTGVDEVVGDLEEPNAESVDLEEEEPVEEEDDTASLLDLEAEPMESEEEDEPVEESDEAEESEEVEVDAQTELPQKHYRRAAASCAAKIAFYRRNFKRGVARRAKERRIIAHIRALIHRLGRQKESEETDLEISQQFALLETSTEEERKHAETHGRGGVLSLLNPILRRLAREHAHEKRLLDSWVHKCDLYCHKNVKHRQRAFNSARGVERRAASVVRTYARLHNLAVGRYRGSVAAYKREQRVFAQITKDRNNELALLKQLMAKLSQLERVKSEATTADVQESDESKESMGAEALQNEMVSSLSGLRALSGSTPAFVEAMTELQRRHPKLRRVRYLLNKIRSDIHREIRIARAKLAASHRSMIRNRSHMHTRARQLRSKRSHHARAVRARKLRQRELHRAHLRCAQIAGYTGHKKSRKGRKARKGKKSRRHSKRRKASCQGLIRYRANRNYTLNLHHANVKDKVNLWRFNRHQSQRWVMKKDGTIRWQGNQRYCLDVRGRRMHNNGYVQMFKCHGGRNQQWVYNSRTGEIKSRQHMAYCLNLHGASVRNGGHINIWKCNRHNSQKWLVPRGRC